MVPILYGNLPELGSGDRNKGIELASYHSNYNFGANITFSKPITSGNAWYAYCFKTKLGSYVNEAAGKRLLPQFSEDGNIFDTIDKITPIDDLVIHFRVRCYTEYGQELFLLGNIPELGGNDIRNAIQMYYEGSSDYWACDVHLPLSKNPYHLEYKYYVCRSVDDKFTESDPAHVMDIAPVNMPTLVEVDDTFRWIDALLEVFTRAPFLSVINKRQHTNLSPIIDPIKTPPSCVSVHFSANIPHVKPEERVVITGSIPELGSWFPYHGLSLYDAEFPIWKGNILISNQNMKFEYKYVIINDSTHEVIWEGPINRYCPGITSQAVDHDYPATLYLSEWWVNPNSDLYKGFGLYVPLFSLRTRDSCGIGQYTDIPKMVDLCNKVGASLIQLLPINDTTEDGSWSDSYPYRQISCFALNPIYIDLLAIASLPSEIITDINNHKAMLEYKPAVEYEEVSAFKMGKLQEIFNLLKGTVDSDPDFQKFVQKNKDWLYSYALFKYYCTKYKTSDFTTWKSHSKISPEEIKQLSQKKHSKLLYILWVQYICEKQFMGAKEYAENHRVALKGDLPIGVCLNSAETWMYPQYFRMNKCAGAPPDEFSTDGQNWGFPTYDWDAMAKDDYDWWRRRLQRMSELYHLLRVDHILGFFRIWEIPRDTCIKGMLGYYFPCNSLPKEEIIRWGLTNFDRYLKPYIRDHLLDKVFGTEKDSIVSNFLTPLHRESDDWYEFKPEADNETKIKDLCKKIYVTKDKRREVRGKLFKFIDNVLLIKDNDKKDHFHVRTMITMKGSCSSWDELDDGEKWRFKDLYLDFVYHRQDDLWCSKADTKLQLLRNTTNMLICAEDLGQLTDAILETLQRNALLSLRVQRMSKNKEKDFDEVNDFNYLSVCCPSTHDSQSIRGWWEEEAEMTKKFWYNQLWRHDEYPKILDIPTQEMIVKQNLWSRSMWAIFLLQDITSLSPTYRCANPFDERINEPSNPHHHWRYRYHFCLEDITNDYGFTSYIHNLIAACHRI